jgi:hypothetical protein
MKTRDGFVSNSSSSSFMIQESKLNSVQLEKIINHKSYLSKAEQGDAWSISNHQKYGVNFICGSTYMDNFDMHYYLTKILKINPAFIEWED